MSGSAELWRSFPHDPRDPSTGSLRASDADREVVAAEVRRLERKQVKRLKSQRPQHELPPAERDEDQ